MLRLALILPPMFGFRQRPATVAPSDLNSDGRQEQVYLRQVRPSVPGSYDEGIMPQPKVSTLSFSGTRNVVHAMARIPSPCSPSDHKAFHRRARVFAQPLDRLSNSK
jgi:hypothetical protein